MSAFDPKRTLSIFGHPHSPCSDLTNNHTPNTLFNSAPNLTPACCMRSKTASPNLRHKCVQLERVTTRPQRWHLAVEVPPAEPNPRVVSMTLKSWNPRRQSRRPTTPASPPTRLLNGLPAIYMVAALSSYCFLHDVGHFHSQSRGPPVI